MITLPIPPGDFRVIKKYGDKLPYIALLDKTETIGFADCVRARREIMKLAYRIEMDALILRAVARAIVAM